MTVKGAADGAGWWRQQARTYNGLHYGGFVILKCLSPTDCHILKDVKFVLCI